MKRISISGKRGSGLFILVDDEDYEELNKYKWHLSGYKERPYASNDRFGLLHRKLMNPPKGMFVDHINHDTLDNRRCNLRLVNPQQNSWNSSKSKCSTNKSRFKGVTKNIKGHWGVFFWKNGKVIADNGSYETELEAAVRYNEIVTKEYGEYATLNEFTEKEKEIIKTLSFQTLADKRMKKTPYHGVLFNNAKQRWQWRFMYKGKLYYDQYCNSADDAKVKLISFLKTFPYPCEIKKYYKEEIG